MANYGDVALSLGPEWARYKLHDQNYGLMIVGHVNGVADAYLTIDPDQEHQFAWVETRYRDEIDINRSKGYRFVKQDEWTKNENLWEWDAEGFVLCKGQRLMARTKERFLEDMAARRKQRDQFMGTNKDEEKALEIAARAGIEITGAEKPNRRSGLTNRG